MGQNDKKVAELIEHIAHKNKDDHNYPVMGGKVVSVDESKMTAVVSVNVHNGLHTEDININVVLNSTEGMYGIPADGSHCLLGGVDGSCRWELLKASAYRKVIIKADTLIQFNEGSLGGLVEIEKLKTNFNKIHDYIKNTLEPAIKDGIDGVGVGTGANGPASALIFETAMAVQDITFDDMENTKIKQG